LPELPEPRMLKRMAIAGHAKPPRRGAAMEMWADGV
jgi:hypothetical protein